MVILFVGKYTSDYNRNKIILDGLRKRDDVEIVEYQFKKRKEFDLNKFKELDSKVDFIYCPSFSHKFVRLIQKHATKPVAFDPLISNYLTKVFDYKNVSRWSPRAYRNYLKDKLPFKSVDVLIADTEEHRKYYNKTFGIPLDKIKILPVGANTTEYKPENKQPESRDFTVGFYGGFIPLQGVKFIIKAAHILKDENDIKFNLIGTGYQWEEMKQKVKDLNLTNIHFDGWSDPEKLPNKLNPFDVCLGIFGETPKASLVIPNKVYHYAAKGKPIITMESKAIREVFTNNQDIKLVSNTGEAIASAILELKKNTEARNQLGNNARKLIEDSLSEDKIAERLIEILKEIK